MSGCSACRRPTTSASREYGPWCPVVAQVAERFLACVMLAHGFARVRCDVCTDEYCWPSPASAATSARAATPSASRSGRSGWIRCSSRPCRTGRWCSPAPSGCAPTVCCGVAGSARSPASPPYRHGRCSHADGRARPRRRHRRLFADAGLSGHLASTPRFGAATPPMPARRHAAFPRTTGRLQHARRHRPATPGRPPDGGQPHHARSKAARRSGMHHSSAGPRLNLFHAHPYRINASAGVDAAVADGRRPAQRSPASRDRRRQAPAS